MPVLIVEPGGEVTEGELPEDDHFDFLAGATGCDATGAVPLTSRLVLWMGVMSSVHPLNSRATALSRRFGFEGPCWGKVVITSQGDGGAITSLTDDQADIVRSFLGVGKTVT